MGRPLQDVTGGIAGLLAEAEEHRDAITYDLLSLGLRWEHLGTPRLTWLDLRAIILHAHETSAYAREKARERGQQASLSETLLAEILNAALAGNWQRGGGKGRRPDRIEVNAAPVGNLDYGRGVSVEEMDRRLRGG